MQEFECQRDSILQHLVVFFFLTVISFWNLPFDLILHGFHGRGID